MRELLELARPRQWIKNLVCLAPLIFSRFLSNPESVRESLIAFACFCLASSAVYAFNDVRDREQDRAHPIKKNRPLAAGRLTVRAALLQSALLASASVAASTFLVPRFRWLLGAFLALQLLYSMTLKRIALMDVISVAVGFVLRVQAGIEAIRCPQSAWMVLCIFFAALMLALGKRRGELTGLGGEAVRTHRPALEQFSLPYLDLLQGISATTALVCYSLYSVTVQSNETFLLTVLPVVFGIARYLMLVIVRTGGEGPDEILTRDGPLLLTILTWAVLCVGILYFDISLFPRPG